MATTKALVKSIMAAQNIDNFKSTIQPWEPGNAAQWVGASRALLQPILPATMRAPHPFRLP